MPGADPAAAMEADMPFTVQNLHSGGMSSMWNELRAFSVVEWIQILWEHGNMSHLVREAGKSEFSKSYVLYLRGKWE
jgi:hypothetical protein